MTAQSSIFPAYIRAEYDAAGNGFEAFERAAADSAGRTRRQFEASFAEISKVINTSLSRGIGSGGKMDLGVGEFRQAAAEAKLYEQAITATLRTATALARETSDTSAATQSYITALQAQRVEAERAHRTAEAQVATYTRLQSALDATSATNSRLAASYREVEMAKYASDAAAAKQEVYGRRVQEGYNQVFAPAMGSRATDNGAGFGALEESLKNREQLVARLNAGVAELEGRFAREAQQSAAASQVAAQAAQAQAESIEALRRAEAGAANGAAMLQALYRGTAMEAGYTSKSYGDVAAAFALADREAQQLAATQAKLASSADQLRSELDPLYAAQKRFDQEMDRADDLLKAGVIGQMEYARATELARGNLQGANAAIHASNDAWTQQARGLGHMRQVYIQTGAQLQDITVSLIGGQKAGVVFAQQLPQLAFALSSMGIQADGTQKGIGRLATFLSGPYSIAFAGAAYVVGTLIGKLWEEDEASKAAADAVKKHRDAIIAMQESLAQSIMSLQDKAKATYIEAEADRIAEINIRKKLAAQLEYAKALLDAQKTRAAAGGQRGEVAALGVETRAADVTRLDKQLQDNQTKLAAATQAATTALGNLQKQVIDDLKTPEGRVNSKYEKRINRAIEDGEGAEAIARLTFARDAELKRIQDAEKALRSSGGARDKEAATVSQVSKLLIENFGGTITSTTGGKHVKGSYHYKGQAVDFVPSGGMGSITKEQIRDVAEKAGLVVKELLGPGDKGHNDHFHLAFEGGKNEINSARIRDKLAREQERIAKEQARAVEEVIQVTNSVIGKYDEARAATIAYADALAEIDKAEKGGGLSKNDADLYRQRAAAKEQQRIIDGMFAGGHEIDIRPMLEDAAKRGGEILEDASREAAENLYRGADAIAKAFGGDVARLLDDLIHASPDGKNGPLGMLQTGIGAGQTSVQERLLADINKIVSKVGDPEKLGNAIGQALEYANMGETYGKGATDLLGIKGSKLGSQMGGAIGGAIAGPLGSIVGGALGSIAGGLFKKTPKASASITMGADGNLTVSGISGSSKALKDAASSNANASITSIQNIAEALGGKVSGTGSVSIGSYKGKIRVDTTGSGRTKGYTSSESKNEARGLFNFDDDAEAAVRFATMDLIKDGVITGIRASTQRLLSNAKDLDAALQRALDFESVFTRLKEYEDPTGAAFDTLDKEFSRLKDIFKEAGASTEEYASLEKLYGIERAQAVKEAGERVTASLKGLFDDLTTGNDALSLSTRKGAAQAKYDGLATRVAAGDTTAYDDYSDAARTLLDIERQISGSTSAYFNLLDQVTDLTRTRIDAETNVSSIASSRPGLFGTTSADSAAPIVSATEAQTKILNAAQTVQTQQLVAMNDNLASLLRATLAGRSPTSATNLRTGVDNF